MAAVMATVLMFQLYPWSEELLARGKAAKFVVLGRLASVESPSHFQTGARATGMIAVERALKGHPRALAIPVLFEYHIDLRPETAQRGIWFIDPEMSEGRFHVRAWAWSPDSEAEIVCAIRGRYLSACGGCVKKNRVARPCPHHGDQQ